MDAGVIVAIVIAVIVVIALVAVALPRARRARAERALERRRTAVVGRHREEAAARESRAELAERRAARDRAEAELHQARARVYERGLADDDLREADDPDPAVKRRETFVDRERPSRTPSGDREVEQRR